MQPQLHALEHELAELAVEQRTNLTGGSACFDGNRCARNPILRNRQVALRAKEAKQ